MDMVLHLKLQHVRQFHCLRQAQVWFQAASALSFEMARYEISFSEYTPIKEISSKLHSIHSFTGSWGLNNNITLLQKHWEEK